MNASRSKTTLKLISLWVFLAVVGITCAYPQYSGRHQGDHARASENSQQRVTWLIVSTFMKLLLLGFQISEKSIHLCFSRSSIGTNKNSRFPQQNYQRNFHPTYGKSTSRGLETDNKAVSHGIRPNVNRQSDGKPKSKEEEKDRKKHVG